MEEEGGRAGLAVPPASKRFKMASGGEGEIHVGFIGGGNLARAITEGLLQAGKYFILYSMTTPLFR